MTDLVGSDALGALHARVGHHFADPGLLELAVTHRSYCAEHAGHEPNERLEFLGDSVLGLVVTEHCYRRFGTMPEGELAKLRAEMVSAPTLADVAEVLGVGPALRLGKGEDASGGRAKPSLLSDALEAVIGAVYLDGGLEPARSLVLDLLAARIDEAAAAGPGVEDHKTQLQELVARHFDELPVYRLTDEGPDHAKRFHAAVSFGGSIQGRGDGGSKKQAEQAAARVAWERLSERVAEGETDA